MKDKFNEFLETVDSCYQKFIIEINDFLIKKDCKCVIKTAKSGFVVSYTLSQNKRTIATFISRKTGMKIRIYPEYIGQYSDFLNTLPDKMKKDIKKASVCKRMINPNSCNPKCVMGYDFFMDNERYKKCRYNAFMPALCEENNPYIMSFLKHEIEFH